MKKITTITSFRCEKDICKKDDCAKCYAEHCKTEQVPETFEELKELCKSITNTRIKLNENFIIIKMDKGYKIELWKNGNVYYYIHQMAKSRTPQQMWSIIKNLVEK